MRQIFLIVILALAGCAAPFPADITPREAFVRYPGGGAPPGAHFVFVNYRGTSHIVFVKYPTGVSVTVVEGAR